MGVDIRFETWKDCFAVLPDPRVVGRTWHCLLDILFLTLHEQVKRLFDVTNWVQGPGIWQSVAAPAGG